MQLTQTGIPGLVVIEPKVFGDNRGYFFESYSERAFAAQGINITFVQDNQSRSSYGVIRGLHYQLDPHAQTKLIRVLSGRILDVAVDMRKGSPAFGQVYTLELSAENKKQLLVPQGFAHGYSVLSDVAEILYKCDAFYNKEAEGGIRYNDAALAIDWQVPADRAIVSEKDLTAPSFADCKNNFVFKP